MHRNGTFVIIIFKTYLKIVIDDQEQIEVNFESIQYLYVSICNQEIIE